MLPQGLEKAPLASDVTPDKPRKRASVPKTLAPKKAPAEKKSKVTVPPMAAAAVAPEIAPEDIAFEDIARIAYHLWESRGYTGGSPDDDWYLAEAYLRERKVAS